MDPLESHMNKLKQMVACFFLIFGKKGQLDSNYGPSDAELFQPHTGLFYKVGFDFLLIWDDGKWVASGYRYASDGSFLSIDQFNNLHLIA